MNVYIEYTRSLTRYVPFSHWAIGFNELCECQGISFFDSHILWATSWSEPFIWNRRQIGCRSSDLLNDPQYRLIKFFPIEYLYKALDSNSKITICGAASELPSVTLHRSDRTLIFSQRVNFCHCLSHWYIRWAGTLGTQQCQITHNSNNTCKWTKPHCIIFLGGR